MKNNALLYTRVSTEEQAKFGLSLDAQLNDLEHYCKENNYKIVNTYSDEGISGYSLDKRQAFKRMINDAKDGDIILFTKLDRFSRNLLDANIVVKQLNEKNVSIKAIFEDDIDTSTADGKFIFDLKLSLAERERNKTSERIQDVNRYKDSIGEVTSGSVPLGYKIENKHLVINEDTVEKIRFIFNEFDKCGCLTDVHKKYVDRYGFYEFSQLRRCMRNEKYIGKHNGNDNYCEPIVSVELFNRCNEKLKKNIKRSPTGAVNIFVGLMRCPECGARLQAFQRPKQNDVVYYCPNHSDKRRSKECSFSKGIHESKIESYLLDHIEDFANEEKKKFSNCNRVDNSTQIKSLEKKISRLKELYIDGDIDKQTYNAKLSRFKEDLSKYDKEEALHSKQSIERVLKANNKEIYDKLNRTNKRSFWQSIIKRIEVDSTEKATFIEFV